MSWHTMRRLPERAAELRAAFDRAFAGAVAHRRRGQAGFLAIRVGVERCAIRLSEIAGLFADRKITRVPAGEAALLGIAGFRGAIVPVYCLPTLLGLVPRRRRRRAGWSSPRRRRWRSLSSVRGSFARLGRRDIAAAIAGDECSALRRSSSAPTAVVRPVMHLPAVIDALGAAETAEAPSCRSEK